MGDAGATASYTINYLYRRRFMGRLLWIVQAIAGMGAVYHGYTQEYWIASLKVVLLVGASFLLFRLPKVPLKQTIAAFMIMTYSVVFLSSLQNSDMSVWLLTLPAFAFALLNKAQAVRADIIGFILLLTNMIWSLLSPSLSYSMDMMINLVGSYLILSYACIEFHQVIINYRNDLAESMSDKRTLQATRTLSAGVAHLINNQMTTVIGYASLIEGEQNRKVIDKITDGAFKTSQHANDLLAYAEQSVSNHRVALNMSQCIERCLEHIVLPETIDVRFHEPAESAWVMGDEQQISKSILDHVLINAVEAKPESYIDIRIRLERIEQHHQLRPGVYVRIDITDDGEGISEEALAQVFDPFFTTKFLGRGMGLAAAMGAAKRHQGWMMLSSQLGHGTQCTIWLPRMADTQLGRY